MSDSSVYSPPSLYAFPGHGTPSGCSIACGAPLPEFADAPMLLGWSSHATNGIPDGSDLAFLTTTVGPNGLFSFTIDTAQPNTHYYARLATQQTPPAWVGDRIEFSTFPDESVSGRIELKWAYGSCQVWKTSPHGRYEQDGTTPLQTPWQDLIAYAPDIVWATGDTHYRGALFQDFGSGDAADPITWADMYWQQFAGMDVMRQARQLVVTDQLGDDHDFSGNNGDSNLSTVTGQHRQTQMAAMQKTFALYQLAHPSAQVRGLYGTYLLTPHVRVIILDDESLDRSIGVDADPGDGSKTFLGEPQTTWFTNTLLDPVTVNIVIASKSWLAPSYGIDQTIQPDDVDKVWAYPTWRDEIASFITSHNSDNPDQPINLVFLGGDRHFIAYATGATNPYGGFPCYVGSGWSQLTLDIRPGEDYDVNYPFTTGSSGPPEVDYVNQYIRGTIIDDPDSQTVTITGELRYLKPDSNLPYQWAMDTYPSPIPISDSWHYL